MLIYSPCRISHTQRLSLLPPWISQLLIARGLAIHPRFPILCFLRRTSLSTLLLSCAATLSSSKWDIHQALAFSPCFLPSSDRVFTFRCNREAGKSHQMEEQSHWDLGIPSSIENLQKSTEIEILTNSKYSQTLSVFSSWYSKARSWIHFLLKFTWSFASWVALS